MKNSILSLLGAILLLGISTRSQAQSIYALTTTGNQINVFDAATPGTIKKSFTLTGITPGSQVVGMDFRPATGQLYILGYLNIIVKTAQLYTVDTATGFASPVGSPLLNFPIDGEVAFDFNPTVDRIRVETSNGLNYRLHPTTGAIAATDSTLRFASTDVNAGKNVHVGAVAYTNSFIASTSTQLFVYDDSLNIFGLQNPPNNGVINTLFSSGISVNSSDPTSDMDFWFDKISSSNLGFFVANTGTSSEDMLYSLNIAGSSITPIGVIGNNLEIKDIAVLIDRTAPAASGHLAYAISSTSNLISFNTGTPDYILSATPVTGITTGYSIKGLDVRPLTGELYAFAYNTTTQSAKIYTINKSTAVATVIGDSLTTLGLSGEINFDFNPTVDRIRLSSSNNKNFRLHPVTGALAATDQNINYAAGDPNVGKDPFASAAAYTNSYAGATATTLFVYDDSLGIFASQIPPNNGTLNTIGSSGLTTNLADPTSDMDILFDSASATNIAFFSNNSGTSTFDKLYTVNTANGAVSLIGNIGYGVAITDISLNITRTAPEPSGQLVYGTTSGNQLITFYTGNPEFVRSQVAISGLPAGYDIVGTDFRNNGGLLHALAYNSTTQTARIYTVNESTGALTAVSADSINPIDLSGRVAVDFNPTVDRLRVETSNNKNFRLNPATGLLAATDMDLNFATGDVNNGTNPNIGSVAYTNARIGAATTTLYAYDDSLNALCTQAPPNNGTLNTIGNSGIIQSTATLSSDLDIYYDPISTSDKAFLAADISGNDNLYSVNLNTGQATLIGKIGFGVSIKDIAVKPDASSVGIKESDLAKFQVALSPNPATERTRLQFTLTEADTYTLHVSDIMGRRINTISQQSGTKGINQIEIRTASLLTGIYILSIELENGESFSTKLLKTN